MQTSLLAFDFPELETALVALGEKKFRARQVWTWVHEKRVASFAEMTNLSQRLREQLTAQFSLRTLAVTEHHTAADGLTEKWLFAAPLAFANDAKTLSQVNEKPSGYIEAVLIREKRLTRHTLCISSAVGCPIGCVFCATGQGGFVRNLTADAIVEQVYRADHDAQQGEFAAQIPTNTRHTRGISNIVFMGMGEPLLNVDAVLKSVRILGDTRGIAFGGRQMTISTVGVIEGIERLCEEETNVRLAVSLHAPDQTLREELVPLAKNWPLADLLIALKAFIARGGKGRHVFIEYCLIDGVNADVTQARALVKLLRGLACKVNLIPLNPTDDYTGKPPPSNIVRAFQDTIVKSGLMCTVRYEKGQDIDAACGQLRVRKERREADVEAGDGNA